MLFNSFEFVFFFPVVVIVYFVIPKKGRNLWLLIASYFFYMNWNASYALLILSSTLITFFSGYLLSVFSFKKLILFTCIISNLGILFFYKYYNFLGELVTRSFSYLNISFEVDRLDILLPVGISFYTFQAISYTIDIYRDGLKPERNFIKYALFVSFFPQLVAGPIERSSRLLPQFSNLKNFDYNRLKSGLLLMLWGFFKKIVIADFLAQIVNQVYNNPSEHFGWSIIIATLFFAIQIYCDFSGYSDIAIGCARIMGFDLMKNFDNPYFSKSIAEFWRRWHISLSTWFKDYVYIPLGGSKQGITKGYVNIIIVFVVSGLWHGASLTFLLWGAIHGIILVLERFITPLSRRLYSFLNWNKNTFSFKLYQNLYVIIIVAFAWLFFRANSISDALLLIRNMGYLKRGLDWVQSLDLSLFFYGSIIMLFYVEFYNSKQSIVKKINEQNMVFRWSLYTVFLLLILIYGSYGGEEVSFIYFQF